MCRRSLKLISTLTAALALSPCMAAQPAPQPQVDYPGALTFINYGTVPTEPPMQKVRVADKYFWVMDDVVPPSIHGVHMLEQTRILDGESVLDLGTGTGLLAVFAAANASRVVATDISPRAVENARYNVERHGVDHLVTVKQGDLLEPVKGDKFDVILFSIAYPFNAQTQHLWRIHERFFAEVEPFLEPGGRIYYQHGSIENLTRVDAMIQKNGFRIARMHMIDVPAFKRRPVVFEIRRANDTSHLR